MIAIGPRWEIPASVDAQCGPQYDRSVCLFPAGANLDAHCSRQRDGLVRAGGNIATRRLCAAGGEALIYFRDRVSQQC